MTKPKYPVMIEVMTGLMKEISTDLEELIEMAKLMKEADDGHLLVNVGVTKRLFENFKELKGIVFVKEDEVSWSGKPSQPHAIKIAEDLHKKEPL